MVTLTQEEKEENGFCDEKEEKKGKEKKRKGKKKIENEWSSFLNL